MLNLLYIIDTDEPSSWNRFSNQNLGLALSDSWRQHWRSFPVLLLFKSKSLKSLQSGYLYHPWVGGSSSRLRLGLSSSLVPARANISLIISSSSWQINLARSALPGLSSSSSGKPLKASPSDPDAISGEICCWQSWNNKSCDDCHDKEGHRDLLTTGGGRARTLSGGSRVWSPPYKGRFCS